MNRRGQLFSSFSPAVGDKAGKAMRHEIRGWGLQRLSRYDLGELLARIRPVPAILTSKSTRHSWSPTRVRP